MDEFHSLNTHFLNTCTKDKDKNLLKIFERFCLFAFEAWDFLLALFPFLWQLKWFCFVADKGAFNTCSQQGALCTTTIVQ